MEFKPTSNIIESKQSQNLALDFEAIHKFCHSKTYIKR